MCKETMPRELQRKRRQWMFGRSNVCRQISFQAHGADANRIAHFPTMPRIPARGQDAPRDSIPTFVLETVQYCKGEGLLNFPKALYSVFLLYLLSHHVILRWKMLSFSTQTHTQSPTIYPGLRLSCFVQNPRSLCTPFRASRIAKES
jgi:hypothetical protein